LNTDEVSAGRQTNTKADKMLTITWPKAFVSGQHFSIKRSADGGVIEICDKSSNGTFVNDALLGKGNTAILKSGDRIQLRFKNADKIILTLNLQSDCEKISGKRQRDEDNEHVQSRDGRPDCHLHAIKITALEQDNRQLEARIEAYTTKLETSARENSNLLRDLKTARSEIEVNGSLVDDLKLRCSDLEAHNNSTEARNHKLEESLQSQKAINENLRLQLVASEERSLKANELLLKVETLTDELNHRRNQNEANSALSTELNISLDKERRQREALETELESCNSVLVALREEVEQRQQAHVSLVAEFRETEAHRRHSEAKVDMLEVMAQKIDDEDRENKSVFVDKISTIHSLIDQLKQDVTVFENSFPLKRPSDTVESCREAIQGMEPLDLKEQHEPRQEVMMMSCTQTHSPERALGKTVSGDSTIAFSKHSDSRLDDTQMIVDASVDISKSGLYSGERQLSMCDSIGITEGEVDIPKIEDDVTKQHRAIALVTSGREGIGLSSGLSQDLAQAGGNSPVVEKNLEQEYSRLGNSRDSVSNEIHGECSKVDSSSDDSSMLICPNNHDGEYSVDDDELS